MYTRKMTHLCPLTPAAGLDRQHCICETLPFPTSINAPTTTDDHPPQTPPSNCTTCCYYLSSTATNSHPLQPALTAANYVRPCCTQPPPVAAKHHPLQPTDIRCSLPLFVALLPPVAARHPLQSTTCQPPVNQLPFVDCCLLLYVANFVYPSVAR
jgi:hypothetical protein